MGTESIKECIENIIDQCFMQHNQERHDFKLRYMVRPGDEVWADHVIDTGYDEINSSMKKWLKDRGMKFNLYFSLSPDAEEYCMNIRRRLFRFKYKDDNNFGYPEKTQCYTFRLVEKKE